MKWANELFLSSDKSQMLERFYILPAFQNGRFALMKIYNERKQFGFLCKIYLKDVYFLVSLSKQSRKYVRFVWFGSLYEFLPTCHLHIYKFR